MTKEFLKVKDVVLLNGGYLSNKDTKQPIYNEDFINAQKHAEWVVTFAEKAKGKDFKGKEADTIEDVKKEVRNALFSNEVKEFIKSPSKPKRNVSDKLHEEALDFINYGKELNKTDRINNFLAKFSVIDEFEEYGLFFGQNIVKLNKLYTMQEIVDAVTETIDLLD